MQTRGIPAVQNLLSGTRNCMNHPSRCEGQLSGHAGALLFTLPLSFHKTIAVIDGTSVLADRVGINKEELVRLAKLQVPIEHFDKSKLSKDRSHPVRLFWMAWTSIMRTCISRLIYFSLTEDGEPEAVNISNVAALVDLEGKPHFNYIVGVVMICQSDCSFFFFSHHVTPDPMIDSAS
ncbi:hypothetical protein BC827DRAFT_320206 [Russula dissimulans]|nr:hypothetical protein BC827DRAFT_320206 [Russula dissimulans]